MILRGCLNLALTLLLGLATGVSAQSVTQLLEQGIYAEETAGDLDAAIEIYNRIVNDAEAERPYVAQALYRLGRCYAKSGREDRANGIFNRLVDEYPDQAELVALARENLPAPAGSKLVVQPAPWEDGELLRFAMKLHSGKPVGDLYYSVRSKEVNGRPAWRMESGMGLPQHEITKFTFVEADYDDFTPIHALMQHTQLGTLRAEFADGERRILMNRPGGEPEPFTQKLDETTYDNEQALYLIRRLPLAEGYETHITLTGRPGATAKAELKVVGIETVTVPAGNFECFQVEIGVPPRIETQWFSTDSNRYVVKVTNPEIVVELTEIARLESGPFHYEDDEAGVSLTAPTGWQIMKSAFSFEKHEFFLTVFPPEMKAKVAVVSQKVESRPSVRTFAEKDLQIYHERRPTYAVDDNSWKTLTVAGSPAVSVMASLEYEGRDATEYRVYVEGPAAYFWFVFRADPETFRAMKDEFDSIVESLELEDVSQEAS